MPWLLFLFIVVPAVELALLILIGRHIGVVPTLGIIVLTGVLGAYLARRQGLGVLRRMQAETAAGRIPAGPLFDGVVILVAGAVLLTPGVLTDILGFFCLIPATRRLIKGFFRRRIERAVREGRMRVSVHFDGERGGFPKEPPREVRPEPKDALSGPGGDSGP